MIRRRWTVATVVAVVLALAASASVWAANRPVDRGSSDSTTATIGVPLPQTGPLQQDMSASQQQSKETSKLKNAMTIANHFDVPTEDVLELRAQGAGFGLLVKVFALSSVTRRSAEELLLSL